MTIHKNFVTEAKKAKRKKKPFNTISYTTGDIALNIDRFNQAMGTSKGNEVGIGGEGSLCEAKRYVRRYYIRPQNKEDIFHWRGKGAGQELKKSTRGAAPLPNQKLFENNQK